MATIPVISKVKSVQGAGTFNSQHGLMYKFEYVMQDGATLVANHKSETGFLPVGADCEYQIKQTNAYGNSGTVGKPKPLHTGGAPFTSPTQTNQQSSFLKSPDVQDMIIRQSSVKAAIDHMVGVGGSFDLSEMLSRAEIIFEYCKSGKIPSELKSRSPF